MFEQVISKAHPAGRSPGERTRPLTENELMELLCQLYDNMDEADKAEWSMDAAQDMIDDQHTYEQYHNLTEGTYDATFWYEAIAEMIEEDSE